ncbi:MAG: hypothetical protein IKE70_01375 [Bacilli bacterium]|nr:hypothetical protein [Bacilli bacterium]
MASYSFIDSIHIEDWKKFLSNNDEVEDSLNRCCSNVADMIANINSINAKTSSINSALSTLKTVSVPNIDDGLKLLSLINEFNNYFKQKSIKIISGINYAELAIDAYNNETEVDEGAKDLFQKILQETADSNIYWIVNESLKTTAFSGIGFIMAYGTDAYNEGGNYVVGDGATKLFELGNKKYFNFSDPKIWVNTAVGASVVALYTGWQYYQNDKGIMTDEDKLRLGIEAGNAALSYAEWTFIAGTIGGIPGVVAAAALSFPTTYILGRAKDYIVGDNIIDEFDGYEVPKNGNGKDGTWDALLDMYKGNQKDYYVGQDAYSEKDYKTKLYNDWEDLVFKDSGQHLSKIFDSYGNNNELNELLDKVTSIKDPDEASLYFNNYIINEASYDTKEIYTFLCNYYDFDIEEALKYRKK